MLGYGFLKSISEHSAEYERENPKLNAWYRLFLRCCNRDSFFVPKTINGEVYRDLHELHVIPLLEHFQQKVLFQLDGAPPHWTRPIRELLNIIYPERWIERGEPIPVTPRSPDIIPLYFFP
ncbi:hypothetical protein AVEN_21922-1 [Araneus ventricosus]|uniref:Tc1-like transposase DDE domain-containing protein n=1 Tax=Araneus ventricosus TaxID=182803 RepID=A0A4Y2D2R9_ARAVE|nr:hypothetical protein AVEN_21922-1 [Araneus ventricosus]